MNILQRVLDGPFVPPGAERAPEAGQRIFSNGLYEGDQYPVGSFRRRLLQQPDVLTIEDCLYGYQRHRQLPLRCELRFYSSTAQWVRDRWAD